MSNKIYSDTQQDKSEKSICNKGIFWVKNIENIEENIIFLKTPCDVYGNTIFDSSVSYTSSDGLSFNHKKSWDLLTKELTENKPFDYYPRGRVEIRNGTAYIYCNPVICTDFLKEWAKKTYNLTLKSGIKEIKLKPDFSTHYQCALIV